LSGPIGICEVVYQQKTTALQAIAGRIPVGARASCKKNENMSEVSGIKGPGARHLSTVCLIGRGRTFSPGIVSKASRRKSKKKEGNYKGERAFFVWGVSRRKILVENSGTVRWALSKKPSQTKNLLMNR